ncbi:MAG TPA: class I SAM-dependent methyltransferase [Flavipsychrobacter sp.]|nr:class I SAM-dependent methyltransferase [Flavipsychrobacter sp.]
MQISEAVALLANNGFPQSGSQIWADLGCGEGTFTLALAHLLQKGSLIYAIDKNKTALNKIPDHYESVFIEKTFADFAAEKLSFINADGILMANSLHFIKDKVSFIKAAKQYLKPNHCFLIVEYDMDKSNPWVPYPVSFSSLQQLFTSLGYIQITKLHTKPSVYRKENIYSAIIAI